MPFYGELIGMMARTMAAALFNPFFWVVVVLVFVQYQRMNKYQEKLFGLTYHNVWRQTLTSIGFGFLGGTAGSVLLMLFGLSLNDLGIIYIWPVALILLLINPRFLCFAYAGGIVAAASLFVRAVMSWWPPLSGWPLLAGLADINLPALISLVGILHLTEALLIYLSGHLGAAPVYVKSSQGDIVGGFNLQRFWPLPLVGLWAMPFPTESQYITNGLAMPDWWPLLGSAVQPGAGEELVYLMVPLVAGLGYSDLALSSSPQEKKSKSALSLSFYSIILIVLSLAANTWSLMLLPAVLAAPFGHEYLVQYSNRSEKASPPRYRYTGQGARVMTVLKGSPAQKVGVLPGDIVIKVNELRVDSSREVKTALDQNLNSSELALLRDGNVLTINLPKLKEEENPGLIFNPDRYTKLYLEVKHRPFQKKWHNFLSFFRGRGKSSK